eukprot:7258269-Alexandrium_andersonii.AAC.1
MLRPLLGPRAVQAQNASSDSACSGIGGSGELQGAPPPSSGELREAVLRTAQRLRRDLDMA